MAGHRFDLPLQLGRIDAEDPAEYHHFHRIHVMFPGFQLQDPGFGDAGFL